MFVISVWDMHPLSVVFKNRGASPTPPSAAHSPLPGLLCPGCCARGRTAFPPLPLMLTQKSFRISQTTRLSNETEQETNEQFQKETGSETGA